MIGNIEHSFHFVYKSKKRRLKEGETTITLCYISVRQV